MEHVYNSIDPDMANILSGIIPLLHWEVQLI
jgi:hypothetical protein